MSLLVICVDDYSYVNCWNLSRTMTYVYGFPTLSCLYIIIFVIVNGSKVQQGQII